MRKSKALILKRTRRARRTRARLRGTEMLPRLSVFRSHRHIYAQLIDDVGGRTLLALSSQKLDKGGQRKDGLPFLLGKELGERARNAGISAAKFDRGSYRYHGRVAKVAEGARAAGLKV